MSTGSSQAIRIRPELAALALGACFSLAVLGQTPPPPSGVDLKAIDNSGRSLPEFLSICLRQLDQSESRSARIFALEPL